MYNDLDFDDRNATLMLLLLMLVVGSVKLQTGADRLQLMYHHVQSTLLVLDRPRRRQRRLDRFHDVIADPRRSLSSPTTASSAAVLVLVRSDSADRRRGRSRLLHRRSVNFVVIVVVEEAVAASW